LRYMWLKYNIKNIQPVFRIILKTKEIS